MQILCSNIAHPFHRIYRLAPRAKLAIHTGAILTLLLWAKTTMRSRAGIDITMRSAPFELPLRTGDTNMKMTVKSTLQSIPGLEGLVRTMWTHVRIWRIRRQCYHADIHADRNYIGWHRRPTSYWQLSSELIFQHHKLEKGLCLPHGSRPIFGERPARKTLTLLERWRDNGFDTNAPVYQASLGVLRAYSTRVFVQPNLPPVYEGILQKIEEALEHVQAGSQSKFLTPIAATSVESSSFDTLQELSLSRRSTRDFSDEPVDPAVIDKAVSIAQLSPSACNRQPWKLHFYDRPEDIQKMLALQNGNSGFGHKVPLLAVVSSDLRGFFDATERFEPVLDGGLFLMSFLLALQSQGLASCCLNWCVSPKIDRIGHEVGGIPKNEKILTFLAIGQPTPGAVVPLSARRPLSDVITRH